MGREGGSSAPEDGMDDLQGRIHALSELPAVFPKGRKYLGEPKRPEWVCELPGAADQSGKVPEGAAAAKLSIKKDR